MLSDEEYLEEYIRFSKVFYRRTRDALLQEEEKGMGPGKPTTRSNRVARDEPLFKVSPFPHARIGTIISASILPNDEGESDSVAIQLKQSENTLQRRRRKKAHVEERRHSRRHGEKETTIRKNALDSEFSPKVKQLSLRLDDSTSSREWGNDSRVPLYNLTGNHDIGLLLQEEKMNVLAGRFEKNFGPMNYVLSIGSFDIVGICATCLYDERLMGSPALKEETLTFLKALEYQNERFLLKQSHGAQARSRVSPVLEKQDEAVKPPLWRRRVLLSHIPLWRSGSTSCGEWRKSKEQQFIDDFSGYSYRNSHSYAITKELLQSVKPIAIFSGDDHDNCVLNHTATVEEDGRVSMEHTVGTFGWLQGKAHYEI